MPNSMTQTMKTANSTAVQYLYPGPKFGNGADLNTISGVFAAYLRGIFDGDVQVL
jgi:hypothetical protein